MTTPDDPLLDRLRRLPPPALDDVTAARTLARAEAAFSAAAAPDRAAPRRSRARWPVPAALAVWGFLYVWGAAREIGRLFPTQRTANAAVARRLIEGGRPGPAQPVPVDHPDLTALDPA